MLDWFSGYVGYDASSLVLGQFFETNSRGEVVRCRDRWETAKGSFESGIQFTKGLPTDNMLVASREQGFLCSDQFVLRLSGNPAKYLQGHNAAGPSVRELGPMIQAVVRSFAEEFRPVDADDDRLPAVHRSRVDVTTAVDLGSHDAVHEWLRMAASTTRSRHGRAVDTSGTVYWGKNSRRWSLKAYCKHCELKVHPAADPGLMNDLLEWSLQHLRIELTLRRPELKDRHSLDESLIWEYVQRVEMPTMKGLASVNEVNLVPSHRAALQLWADGHDVSRYYSRATFYRYRRSLLDLVGVDIAMDAAAQVKADPYALLGVEELQRREVLVVPTTIQRSLFGAR